MTDINVKRNRAMAMFLGGSYRSEDSVWDFPMDYPLMIGGQAIYWVNDIDLIFDKSWDFLMPVAIKGSEMCGENWIKTKGGLDIKEIFEWLGDWCIKECEENKMICW